MHYRIVQLVLAALVLCACGGAPPVAIANRGGTATASCPFQPRFDTDARRYGNLDNDDPDYQEWTPWQLSVELTGEDPLRGTAVLTGHSLTIRLPVSGRLDPARCALLLSNVGHDPITFTVRFGATITGDVRSIDDVWLLGPPFPARR